jgi:hypothetical protein
MYIVTLRVMCFITAERDEHVLSGGVIWIQK